MQPFYGQNLVPNFSFEERDSCPTLGDQVEFSVGWSKYSNSASTPDYYNTCSSPNTYGIPQNLGNFQQDNRNCNAYMGLITFGVSGNDREHIGVELSQPLILGEKYFLSFYTVMGEDLIAGIQFGMPSNNIGIRLSTVPYDQSNPFPIDNVSHLRSAPVITDSTNWALITGSIIADSAYKYLVLGNFYNDLNTDTLQYNCGICLNTESYYLVDDVCVSLDSALCNGGIASLPCNLSLEENVIGKQISIFPNPTVDFFIIKNDNAQSSFNITIFNAMGQVLERIENVTFNNSQIDISNYNNGLLLINLEVDNKQYSYKLFKQ